MTIEAQGDTPHLNIQLTPAHFQDITINGLTPVIINIAPVTNLNMLLEIAENEKHEQLEVSLLD